MIAPPSIDRKLLTWAPVTWALLLPMMVLGIGWPWLTVPQDLAMAGVLASLGAVVGFHLKYRSRFGVAAGLGMNLLGAALFICLVSACVLVVSRMAERPELSAPALAATMLSLLLSAVLGMALRHRLHAQAAREGRFDALLSPFVDRERFVVYGHPLDAPPPARGGMSIALAAAVGANVPLLAQFAGVGKPVLMMAVTGIAVPACAYALYALLGPGIVHFACLRRLEQSAGRRFERDDAQFLAQSRRSFWFARWLCRPEDLAPVAPSPLPAEAARPRAAMKRQQRRRSAPAASKPNRTM